MDGIITDGNKFYGNVLHST